MPLQKLQLRPGVNRESTTLANEGTWFEMDKVRFRSGYPEKLGGWVKDTGIQETGLTPPTGSFWGTCRSLWNWITLSGYNLMALGTHLKYYIQQSNGGEFYDITPIRDTNVIAANAFTTTNGSTTVIVNDPGYGAANGDFVTISGVGGAVNGIPAAALNQEFRITYIDSSTYSITVASPATSSGTTGAATFAYQISIGEETFTFLTGWGAGGFGGTTVISATTTLNGALNNSATTITVISTTGFAAAGAIGINGEYITYSGKTATTFTGCTRGVGSTAVAHNSGDTVNQYGNASGWGQAATSGIGAQMRLWSQSNFGQDLVINPRGGALYLWKVNANPLIYDRAVLLSPTSPSPYTTDSGCPTVSNSVTVSDASRFVIAFGCNDYGSVVQDPLLIRWSDQEDYAVWNPAATNQAGSYRLSTGSSIVAHQQTRQEILVWTDAAIYSMQYLGPPYIWGFQVLGYNISIAGPNSVATAANITYWMGLDKFYMYSGRVETLYCPLRQYIFGDINLQQQYQIYGGTNEGYNEIWWFYCSANSTVIDRYVIYNHLERIWSYGNLSRTAWLDTPLRDFPSAAGYNGQLIYHESGVDDGTTNPPSPISAYIQSADFNIGDGHNYGFAWRMIPDITFDGSYVNNPQVTFTLRPRQNPGANYSAAGTPTVTSTQNYQGQRNYTVQQFTQIVYTRIRGRQMAFKVSSDGLGVNWQLGVPSLDVRPDGRR
jgi:hypothetical protein